jgi:hypothetical protein
MEVLLKSLLLQIRFTIQSNRLPEKACYRGAEKFSLA